MPLLPCDRPKTHQSLADHRSSRRPPIAVLIALIAGSVAQAQAQDAPIALEDILIESGTLSGEPIDPSKLGTSTTVITGEALERRQIRNAADALRTVPGLAVSRTGNSGGLTQVRIRGAEGNQVKVLIDGVEVNSLDAGDFDFSTLLAADIDRIEVLRGPQSGLYGANALSGVINIVTRKGGAPRVTATAEAGSLETKHIGANASAGSDKGYFSISAVRRETDGFNVAREGSEDDGSEQRAIFARFGLSPTDYFRIQAVGRFQSNDADTDSDVDGDGFVDDFPGATNEREQTLGSVSAVLDTFGKRWTHKVFANYLEDNFVSINPTLALPFTNDGERTRFGYQTTLTADMGSFGSHQLTGLIEQIDESFEGRGNEQFNFPPFFVGTQTIASRSNTGYAAEYQGAFADRLFLTGNIRYDDKNSFEDATTYRLTGAYSFPATGTRLHVSYGKGITDPTFFEQFGSSLDFKGNPALTPEASIGWDVGVEQKFWADRISVDLTYFQANLTDEIASGQQDVDGDGIPDNTVINQFGESERQGIELTLTAQLTRSLLLTGSYTYTDATEPDGSEEVRRPPHAASLGLAYRFANGRGKLNADVIYNGDTKDFCFGFACPSPVVTLDDYVLVNAAASYKVDHDIELFGRVENLLDTDYEEVFSYSAAPIAAYGGVKVTFGDERRPLEPKGK